MKSLNIKPGDVLEVYNRNDGPYIPRETEIIYLGEEDIDGVKYALYFTIDNNKKKGYVSDIYKRPMDVFKDFIDQGIYRNNSGSKIPKSILKDIEFNVEKQKENLAVFEEEVQKKLKKISPAVKKRRSSKGSSKGSSPDVKNEKDSVLTSDVKNEILSYFSDKKHARKHYKGGRIKTTKKTRCCKVQKSRKSRKH